MDSAEEKTPLVALPTTYDRKPHRKTSRKQSSFKSNLARPTSSDSSAKVDLGQFLSSAQISCHNVTFSVITGTLMNKQSKRVLTDVSAIFKPGINAIMGPSGSGKTTLLDLLAQRRDKNLLEGDILINGRQFPENFNFCSGYVAQDDVLSLALTVEENLMFSANLRMKNCSHMDRAKRVEQLIAELGLEQCQYTTIGDPFSKGVSGGERKRCCIGMELVNQPPVVFLDEPTTGLDSSTAYSVISLLKHLSFGRNSTFIITIHQPRFSIYRLFDRLHLLSQTGRTVYHGPADKTLDYFETLGYYCEEYCNPAEFLLDLVLDQTVSLTRQNSAVSSTNEDDPLSSRKVSRNRGDDGSLLMKDLNKSFRVSQFNQDLQQECEKILSTEGELISDSGAKFARSWFTQFYHLTVRNAKGLIVFPGKVLAPCLVAFLICAILGFLLWDWQYDNIGYQNIDGVIFFFEVVLVFANFECIHALLSEREIFTVESKNGYYRVSAYLAAKFAGDLIPRQGSKITVFVCCLYLFVQFKREVEAFAIFYSASILTCLASMALFTSVTSFSGRFAIAAALLPTIALIMVFTAGFFANIGTLPPLLESFRYVSIIWYSMSILTATQFTDVEFCDNQNLLIQNGTEVSPYLCVSGEYYLDLYGVNYSGLGYFGNFMGLLGFVVVLYILTYFSCLRASWMNK